MASLLEKYARLVDGLYTKTTNREISWEISSWDEDLYGTIGSRRIKLSGGRNADGAPIERLEMVDGDSTIDGFASTTLSNVKPSDNFSSSYTKMRALRISAERQARGADDVLDDLLGNLEG